MVNGQIEASHISNFSYQISEDGKRAKLIVNSIALKKTSEDVQRRSNIFKRIFDKMFK